MNAGDASNSPFSHLIFGCGYLGARIASLWMEQGKSVAALTRNRTVQLRQLGIEPVVGDVLQPLENLPQTETVLYAVGFDRKSGKSFREVYLDGLQNVVQSLPRPKRFIYISSTSVYGQTDGGWVDELSPTEPIEENGKTVLEAERLLREAIPSAIILRFAGIYGPGRVIRRTAIEKGEPLLGDAEKWLNLIHVEDGAQAVLAAEARAQLGATYLIADGRPVRRREFYTFMSQLLDAPPARFESSTVDSAANSHDRANKRVGNRQMVEKLGVKLKFAEFQSGLRASQWKNTFE